MGLRKMILVSNISHRLSRTKLFFRAISHRSSTIIFLYTVHVRINSGMSRVSTVQLVYVGKVGKFI